jgi:hypothetical protein
MSTGRFYHGFGIIGYDYVRTDYQDGHIHFTIRQPKASLCCPACGSSKVSPRGSVTRTFRTPKISTVDLVHDQVEVAFWSKMATLTKSTEQDITFSEPDSNRCNT